jgi:hypothetical protein
MGSFLVPVITKPPISGTNAPLLSKVHLIDPSVKVYRISQVARTLSRNPGDLLKNTTKREKDHD